MERFKKFIKTNEALLVSKPANIYYLTGFKGATEKEREAFVLITQNKIYLITSQLYSYWKTKNDDVKIVIMKDKGFSETIIDTLSADIKILNFETADLKYIEYKSILSKLKARNLVIDFRESEGLIEAMRVVKTDDEIEFIKKAQWLTGETLKQAIGLLEDGGYKDFTELSLAEKIRQISFEIGGEGLGFDTIVASGAGSAEPHYQPTNDPIQPNACLLIDMGIKYKGYTGDLTRTFYIGEPPAEFEEDYNLVAECKSKVIKQIKSGVGINLLQTTAENYFDEFDVNDYFIHSIGHGVGLEIHEAPSGSRNKEILLQEKNIFTVEPGLYFADEYGIRLEDMILVTKDGYEILQSFSSKSYIIPI